MLHLGKYQLGDHFGIVHFADFHLGDNYFGQIKFSDEKKDHLGNY
jgi:hypothetical protein